ncbi:MAG: FG-GAP repeat protein [Methylococcales bacterium]
MVLLLRFLLLVLFAGFILDARAAVAVTPPEGLRGAQWADIQRQIEAPKYLARGSRAGYEAHNPRQGFHIQYRRDGQTLIGPRDLGLGAYHIGLKLAAIGYGDRLTSLIAPESIASQGAARVDYRWNAALREWWVNGPAGVEQTFELRTRSPGFAPGQPLMLAMTLDTDLGATLGDQGLSLSSSDRAVRIGYGKLRVWDAHGRTLPARMRLSGTRLALSIDDHQARYPVTIDPTFAQQAHLKASNTDSFDWFGYSAVAISGDTVWSGRKARTATARASVATSPTTRPMPARPMFSCARAQPGASRLI